MTFSIEPPMAWVWPSFSIASSISAFRRWRTSGSANFCIFSSIVPVVA